jgi:hypothetical protein
MLLHTLFYTVTPPSKYTHTPSPTTVAQSKLTNHPPSLSLAFLLSYFAFVDVTLAEDSRRISFRVLG